MLVPLRFSFTNTDLAIRGGSVLLLIPVGGGGGGGGGGVLWVFFGITLFPGLNVQFFRPHQKQTIFLCGLQQNNFFFAFIFICFSAHNFPFRRCHHIHFDFATLFFHKKGKTILFKLCRNEVT